jgi:hypothetical protein
MDLARRAEAQTGRPQYVVKAGALWIITERMPLLGTWYTSDGVRHG